MQVILLALTLAVLPLAPASAQEAANDRPPALRGRLYEFMEFGVALAWNPAQWTARTSGSTISGGRVVETVSLESSVGIADVEMWSATPEQVDATLERCIEERRAQIEARSDMGDFALVQPPALQGGYPFGAGISARWAGLIRIEDGVDLPAAIGVTCQRGPDATALGVPMVSIIRETRIGIGIGVGAGPGWPSIFEGYSYRAVEPGGGAIVDIRALLAPGERLAGQLVVRVSMENLDVTPVSIDAMAFLAG
ncbi:MAG: hypothetical protein ACR2J8_14890, partial [Thermomicrobiales bacterium]